MGDYYCSVLGAGVGALCGFLECVLHPLGLVVICVVCHLFLGGLF